MQGSGKSWQSWLRFCMSYMVRPPSFPFFFCPYFSIIFFFVSVIIIVIFSLISFLFWIHYPLSHSQHTYGIPKILKFQVRLSSSLFILNQLLMLPFFLQIIQNCFALNSTCKNSDYLLDSIMQDLEKRSSMATMRPLVSLRGSSAIFTNLILHSHHYL